MEAELCCECNDFTGGAGRGDGSLYCGDFGPYCEACHYNAMCEYTDVLETKIDRLTARGIEDMQQRIAELEEENKNLLELVDLDTHGIELLENKISHLEAAQRWIPAVKALPKKADWSGDRVLVYTGEGCICTGLYEGEDADGWPDKFNDSGFITHWMPLPPTPQEQYIELPEIETIGKAKLRVNQISELPTPWDEK